MTCGGEEHLIDGCSKKMNVYELKVRIETVTKIPPWRQQLLLELDVLAAGTSLGEAGVTDSSIVTLVQLGGEGSDGNDSDHDSMPSLIDSDLE